MTRKIACLNNISQQGLLVLPTNYEIIDNQEEADAWLIRSIKLHDVKFPKELRAIGRAGAGVNNIPLDRCAEEGIVVFNSPGANANGVAELVMAMAILASRDIVGGINAVRNLEAKANVDKEVEKVKKAFVGTEIRGKTLGIIGLGAIGHLVANAAVGMGMKVIGYDPMIPVEFAWKLNTEVQHADSIESMLPDLDFLSIHVPLNDKTKHMINHERLQKMKDGAVLLNFARDILCDEEAVLEALESGKLGKYVVDFPNDVNIHFPNTILTPHIGASTEESEENCARMVAKQVAQYLDHGSIQNSVNYPNINLEMQESPTRVVVLHKNTPGVLREFTNYIAENGYNISKMASNSKGDYAAAIVDVDKKLERDFVLQLREYPNILRVRVIYKEEE